MSRYRNIQKISKKNNPFIKREKELKEKIGIFTRNYYRNRCYDNKEYYRYMNNLRLEIKELLRKQENELFIQSPRRRFIYYDQLSKFKHVYCRWKNSTHKTYLELKGTL